MAEVSLVAVKTEDPRLEELRRWLKSLRHTHGIAYKRVAEEVGASPGQIFRFMNDGDPYVPKPEVIEKLFAFREKLGEAPEAGDEPAAPPKTRLEFVMTAGAAHVQALCHECRTRRLMGLLSGYSGAGKTTALRYYMDSVGPDQVIFVTCDATFTVKEVLREIAAQLGEGTSGTARAIMRKIVTQLQKRPRLIVVDEANQLVNGDRTGGLPKVNILRSIYDEAGTVGVVLAGTPDLLAAVLEGPPSLAQLRSRLRRMVQLEPPGPEDVERLLAGFPLDAEARAAFVRRARDTRNGGLRWLETTVNTAVNLVGPGELITAEVIAEADALTLEAFARGDRR